MLRLGARIVVVLLVLSPAAVPTLRTAEAAMHDGLIVDVDDIQTARANRIRLENMFDRLAGQTLRLPAGVIHVDRAVVLKPEHSGITIEGEGPQTVLKNSHDASDFWTIPAIVAEGGGLGYADPFTADDDRRRVTLTETADLRAYVPGRLVYSFRWDGYTKPDPGQHVTRHRVVRQIGFRRLELDTPVDPKADMLKWLDAAPIRGPKEGAVSVAIEEPANLSMFAVGNTVLVTDGATMANEARGEFRLVTAIEQNPPAVRLDRPLRWSYAAPSALVHVRPITNVTFRNLTFGKPVHEQGMACTFKFCTNFRFDRVHCDFVFNFGACAKFQFNDCVSVESLNLNTCQDIVINGGKYRAFYFEEGCGDIDATDCVIGPAFQNGVMTVVDCERLRLTRCRIFGSAIMPLSIVGRENVFDNVTIEETKQPDIKSYVCGDRTRATGVKSDVGIVFHNGVEQVVRDVQAPGIWLGWSDQLKSGGVAGGLTTPKLTTLSPGWIVLPGSIAGSAPPR